MQVTLRVAGVLSAETCLPVVLQERHIFHDTYGVLNGTRHACLLQLCDWEEAELTAMLWVAAVTCDFHGCFCKVNPALRSHREITSDLKAFLYLHIALPYIAHGSVSPLADASLAVGHPYDSASTSVRVHTNFIC